ncbi:uncharacterized protein LOC130897913 isoform X1 [Diorhabda carinulata]|uniref:uncharacterized protein LOC130897913 isoform X1 n=2 Tax=Diorhabda carinulata TaxID=1163345 RepID=UPI0025A17A6F|nr:uncharacterized protein LOC130897913 isoform X1 [Diorhabda carinulata]
MRASMCSNKLLLYFFIGVLTVPIFCGIDIVVEGLPLRRRELDTNQDILAGADFLSILMGSSLKETYNDITSTVPSTTILVEIDTEPDYTTKRDKRNSDSNFDTTYTNSLITNAVLSSSQSTERFDVSDSSTNKDGVVVAVSISTSIGRSRGIPSYKYSTSELQLPSPIEAVNQTATEKTINRDYFGSEHRPSIIAEASKSELIVEETEPITKDNESAPDSSLNYQTTTFLDQNLSNKQTIYQDNPRSVSYTLTLPGIPVESDKSQPHERHERNYKNSFVNTFESNLNKSTEKPWAKYTPTTPLPVDLPKVYAHPEQNYEVDEELSVVTNGRAHGIQPTKPEKKDDNQKFGYVVEGKNYRKYRVEERTADGFIVGEYGVVSHDDGSLRGVRYTADGTINPRLISEALMKFLSL